MQDHTFGGIMTPATPIKALQCRVECSTIRYTLYQSNQGTEAFYSVSVSDDEYGSAYAEDVTDDLSAAERFLQLLCEEAVEPCHLLAIVEDALPLR